MGVGVVSHLEFQVKWISTIARLPVTRKKPTYQINIEPFPYKRCDCKSIHISETGSDANTLPDRMTHCTVLDTQKRRLFL